jgi:hypothetical protein
MTKGPTREMSLLPGDRLMDTSPNQKNAETRDSIPRVQHIAYFQEVLEGIAEGVTFDGLRCRLRQVAVELSRRFESRLPPSRVQDAYTFWNPTTDAIGETMRLTLVEHRPLPSKRASVDAYREATFTLTPTGSELVRESKGNESAFRRLLTPRLLEQHPNFSSICEALAQEPLVVPEYSEEDLVTFQRHSPSWTSALGENAAARMREAMQTASVSAALVTAQVKEALGKRFPAGSEPTRKSVLDTVKAALVAAALETRGVRMDATTFNILAEWGSQLYLLNESRYVHGIPAGRTIWSTAEIELGEGATRVQRRGLSEYAEAVMSEIGAAYRHLAEALSAELGGHAVLYPYLEIFKVRALVAFRVRVNNPVVDKVIAEIAEGSRKAPYRVELALGQGRWQAASETPFRIGARRYYVILVKPEGD